MVFTNVYNPRRAVSRKREYRRTLVRRGATLGANCTIVCGVTIVEYAFKGRRPEPRGQTEAETDGREGLKSLAILIALYLSSRDVRKISLPLQY
jgi:hypothetical protein